mmetsp:Transcript_6284/g.15567  ORF Transcript_6284/g.15567 Transcript_6284/m.15567 type:complete len:285 (-) Transcript_6284:956-1810(-)
MDELEIRGGSPAGVVQRRLVAVVHDGQHLPRTASHFYHEEPDHFRPPAAARQMQERFPEAIGAPKGRWSPCDGHRGPVVRLVELANALLEAFEVGSLSHEVVENVRVLRVDLYFYGTGIRNGRGWWCEFRAILAVDERSELRGPENEIQTLGTEAGGQGLSLENSLVRRGPVAAARFRRRNRRGSIDARFESLAFLQRPRGGVIVVIVFRQRWIETVFCCGVRLLYEGPSELLTEIVATARGRYVSGLALTKTAVLHDRKEGCPGPVLDVVLQKAVLKTLLQID